MKLKKQKNANKIRNRQIILCMFFILLFLGLGILIFFIPNLKKQEIIITIIMIVILLGMMLDSLGRVIKS